MDDQIYLPARGPAFRAVAVLLALFSLSATGFLMLRWLRTEGEQPAGASGPELRYFLDWPKDAKPELVLLLTGQQHGYTQPCGCSHPQYGGLERRYNLLQQLQKERGWSFAALDVGDVAQDRGPQALLKYVVSMKALKKMDYAAVGLGLNELNMPLLAALAEYTLNDKDKKPRVLAANLKKEDLADMVADYQIVGAGSQPRIGVASIIGPTMMKNNLDRSLTFDMDDGAVVKKLLAGFDADKVDIRVLLYGGPFEEAKRFAERFPQFRAIIYQSPEDDPPERPTRVGDTALITTGQKGKYVGLFGVYRTGQANRPFALYYQLVLVGPEYETPADQVQSQPILALMEEYARDVRAKNYLARYPKMKHLIQNQDAYKNAEYVGSEACKKCHEESYKVWKNSPHAHAYDTLVKAQRPSLRQFDGECVKCHVTGFENVTGFTNEKDSVKLKDVGCENCHGPGSLHVKNQNVRKTDAKLNDLMNPYRTPAKETPAEKEKRLFRLGDACQHCHDHDNDVNWNIAKWAKIEHHEPKE
jgi:hypothetical protein